MIRATIWTVGLFGAGAALARAFPGTWTEPLVLIALGLALLFASRPARTLPRGARAPRPASQPKVPAIGARAASKAPVPVSAVSSATPAQHTA
jgi:hypothetical protein